MSYSFNIQHLYICRSIRNWNAYVNEAKNVNKDSRKIIQLFWVNVAVYVK